MKPNLQQTADKATKMDNSACSLFVVIDLTITASNLLSILQGHCSLLLAWNSVPGAYSYTSSCLCYIVSLSRHVHHLTGS